MVLYKNRIYYAIRGKLHENDCFLFTNIALFSNATYPYAFKYITFPINPLYKSSTSSNTWWEVEFHMNDFTLTDIEYLLTKKHKDMLISNDKQLINLGLKLLVNKMKENGVL